MALDISRVQAILFDIDGTLSDTDDLFTMKLARLLRPGNFLFRRRDPGPFARWLIMTIEGPGNFFYGLPDRLGWDEKLATLSDLAARRFQTQKKAAKFLLIEGVSEMLRLLKPHYPLGVVSARGQRSTMDFLEQFELTPFFKAIVTAQTCRYTKPYPDPILYAARELGVPASACLMVGDTTVDMLAGKAAGAQNVGVLCGFGEERELVHSGANLILPATPALAATLLAKKSVDSGPDKN